MPPAALPPLSGPDRSDIFQPEAPDRPTADRKQSNPPAVSALWPRHPSRGFCAFVAVSYTHLDVYKRQLLAGGLAVVLILFAAAAIYFGMIVKDRSGSQLPEETEKPVMVEPVSYTHLDVYKRQGIS